MQEFNNFIKLYRDTKEFIIEKPKTALSIPACLGGFWQLSNLLLMGLPYGRYFSITQAFTDGILALFFIALIILLSMIISVPIDYIKRFKEKYDKNGKSDFFQITFFFILCFSTLLIITAFLLILTSSDVPNISFIVSTILSLLLIAIVLVVGIYFINKNVYKKNIKTGTIQNTDKRKEKEKDKVYFSIGLFLFSLALLWSFLIIFNAFLFSPKNLDNVKFIYCIVDKEYLNRESRNIRYYNDKYIFVEVQIPKGTFFIRKYEYEEFFSSDACDNKEIKTANNF